MYGRKLTSKSTAIRFRSFDEALDEKKVKERKPTGGGRLSDLISFPMILFNSVGAWFDLRNSQCGVNGIFR